jgi:monoamine oxidase
MPDYDVVVIGAGAAGLAAAHALSAQGYSLAILEARDRIGGRVFTVQPAGSALPVELGAEFVEGDMPAILPIARAARLTLCEQHGSIWGSFAGNLSELDDESDGDESEARILQAMRE